MKKLMYIIIISLNINLISAKNPVSELINRIDYGASKKFIFELSDQTAKEDFFVLDSKRGKIWIKGNNWISVATGLNWYLKYYASVHISWNNPKAKLNHLPKIKTSEKYSTSMLKRYYFNYCTFSYSMPFWDWSRWQQEIDWMALHGVNMPLAINGVASVWRNTLIEMGCSLEQIDAFIASPVHQAWWLMGNLEGNNIEGVEQQIPNDWYLNQEELQKKIVARYDEWGITPVFVGYNGMVPSGTDEVLGVQTKKQGKWCGFKRPHFLNPSDPQFKQLSQVYYQEMRELFGEVEYYAIDPFHEGGSTDNINLSEAGEEIFNAMKRSNPMAKWVVQAWQQNPRMKMIEGLPTGDVIVLDLFSESRPQWGDPQSSWYRQNGFSYHDWIYCMLLNFGGNIGMYGKLDRVISGYYLAQQEHNGRNMIGVGATMEGIENNPVMFELLFELPWRKEQFTKEEWLDGWVRARYGQMDTATQTKMRQVWQIIANTSYSDDYYSTQEGATESIFCARPSLNIDKTSSWGSTKLYYEADSLLKALELMIAQEDKFKNNNNFEYDITDLARQCIADYAKDVLNDIEKAFDKGDTVGFKELSFEFLDLILLQDDVLSARREFVVGAWLERAIEMGETPQMKSYYNQQARRIITTWGGREAANEGGLRDYSHREWAGIMRDLYYTRWKMFFDYVSKHKEIPVNYDFFEMENNWVLSNKQYVSKATSDPIQMAKRTLAKLEK